MRRKSKLCSGTVSEKRVARRVGGRNTPASGAMVGAKGDVELGTFLMECKSTVKNSMSVKLDWLLKICSEASAKGKKPALTVNFVTENGTPVRNGNYVLLREVDFLELLDE